MPSESDHRQQAIANRGLAEHLVVTFSQTPTQHQGASMQWAAIAAFYCAVHCMEAHFATQGVHNKTHKKRAEKMRETRYGIPPAVQADYLQLKSWSELARYDCFPFSEGYVSQAVLQQRLPTVTNFIGL